MKKNYTILSIETSMDDTCAAVTVNEKVMSNVIASQTAFHEEYGGTVPHIARRKHVEWIDGVIGEALRRAGIHGTRNEFRPGPPLTCLPAGRAPTRQTHLLPYEGGGLDAVAVTYGPGLAPSLEVGIAKAKELAKGCQKPLIAVNHMEGHLLSVFAKNSRGKGIFSTGYPQFPALGFLISGGHTQLVVMRGIGDYELVGETLDDAAGEAYDKVARMLNLGYPGGPILSELAKKGDPSAFELPEPMKHRRDLDFSFSGLKTAALYTLTRQLKPPYSKTIVENFAASFESAVLAMMERRLKRAIVQYKPKMLLLGGGVISNAAIRKRVRKTAAKQGVKTFIPYSQKLFTDNAGMIGVVAWHKALRGEFVEEIETLDRVPNLGF